MQCFGGAKNHMVVLPDADMDQTVDALIGAGYGSAGERCMAISVVVAVGNDGQFRALCEVLGSPELGRDARYATNGARIVNRDTLEPTLQELVAAFPAEDLTARLIARGVPAGPVNTIGEIFQDPFVEARRKWWTG